MVSDRIISKDKCKFVQMLLLLLDSYHWFFVLLNILFSCFNSLKHKNIEKKYLVIIYFTGLLNRRLVWDISWLLLVRLVYSLKSTGTLVPKLYLVSRHTVFELKPVLELWSWHKFDCWPIIKNRLVFGILIRLLANGTEKTLGKDNQKKTG